MLKSISLTDWIGIYGAVLSTLLFARELWKTWQSRVAAQVKVALEVGELGPSYELHFAVKVTNHLDRPVVIKGIKFTDSPKLTPKQRSEWLFVHERGPTVPAHDACEWRQSLGPLVAKFGVGTRIRAEAWLTTGEILPSRWIPVPAPKQPAGNSPPPVI